MNDDNDAMSSPSDEETEIAALRAAVTELERTERDAKAEIARLSKIISEQRDTVDQLREAVRAQSAKLSGMAATTTELARTMTEQEEDALGLTYPAAAMRASYQRGKRDGGGSCRMCGFRS